MLNVEVIKWGVPVALSRVLEDSPCTIYRSATVVQSTECATALYSTAPSGTPLCEFGRSSPSIRRGNYSGKYPLVVYQWLITSNDACKSEISSWVIRSVGLQHKYETIRFATHPQTHSLDEHLPIMSTPTVEYRMLGKSGLRVSVPILGAMSFGSSKWSAWVLDEEPSLEIMKAAWDLGINTIDTANVYSNGESERLVAKFIKKYQIPRHQIVIASKCFGLVADDVDTRTSVIPGLDKLPQYVNQRGLSRAAIFNAVEASLARLETPYLDLLQIHRYDSEVPAEETMKALHDLVQSGKVRYIGASSMRCWQFAHLNEVASKNGWTKFVSMQDEYSLLYREEEREMLAYCKFNGIGVIPWAPLAAGDLARPVGVESVRLNSAKGTVFEKKLSEADITIINRVEELAKKKGIKMGQIALAWVGQKVASPIVGVNSIQRLKESIVTGIVLTPEEVAYLEEPYLPKVIRGHA